MANFYFSLKYTSSRITITFENISSVTIPESLGCGLGPQEVPEGGGINVLGSPWRASAGNRATL